VREKAAKRDFVRGRKILGMLHKRMLEASRTCGLLVTKAMEESSESPKMSMKVCAEEGAAIWCCVLTSVSEVMSDRCSSANDFKEKTGQRRAETSSAGGERRLTFGSSASSTRLVKRVLRERFNDGSDIEGKRLRLPLLVRERRRSHTTNAIMQVMSRAMHNATALPIRAA
jgi:hypothetical protein